MLRHEDNIASRLGGNNLQPLAGISVTVTDNVTGLPASLYDDALGTVPLAQPRTTDENGYYGFNAPDGSYTLTFTGVRIAPFTRQIVLDDPKDNPYATLAGLSAGSGSSLVTFTQAGAGAVPRDLQARGRDMAVLAKDFGAVGNNVADDTAALQSAIDSVYARGGGEVLLNGNYKITATLDLKPYVVLVGSSWSTTSIQYSGANGTTVIRTVKPTGYVPPLVLGAGVRRMTLNGKNQANGNTGIDVSDARACIFESLEIANMNVGMCFNKATGAAGQSYWNRVSQCAFASCYTAVMFAGATNRNTFDTNTYNTCHVAYDFTPAGNVAETNVFTNENIEGCNSWAEWAGTIYGQTWIGLTVENPSTNGFSCTVKDPGRQLFVNLGLIPANNAAAVDFYKINATFSTLLGSKNSSAGFSYGHRVVEEFQPFGGIRLKAFYGTGALSATIGAGAKTTVDISVAGAEIGDLVTATCYADLQGCVMQAWVRTNGSIRVNVINPTAGPITTGATTIVATVQKYG